MYTLHLGNAEDILPTLAPASVDALVTDPPSGISFMEADWDSDKGGRDQWIAWLTGILTDCRRVLKPGAHALIWALPRTSHWTATAVEDAGWQLRDVITHHFATGFPKSHDVSKALDRLAGAERTVLGTYPGATNIGKGSANRYIVDQYHGERTSVTVTSPATPEAQAWQGYGTALKPASEHWILARAPLTELTIARQVLATGTGTLNIDGCRIGTESTQKTMHGCSMVAHGAPIKETLTVGSPNGRWPANVLLSCHDCEDGPCDACPVAELDRQSDVRKSGGWPPAGGQGSYVNTYGAPNELGIPQFGPSEGGASRFFYVAKPSRAEREAGISQEAIRCGVLPLRTNGRGKEARNTHPTVKSIKLMQYLTRLITPPGGVVLDPFAGSGTTGIACVREGFNFIGIEQSPEYHSIAEQRLAAQAVS